MPIDKFIKPDEETAELDRNDGVIPPESSLYKEKMMRETIGKQVINCLTMNDFAL
jgi:hypothetical protein